MATHHTPDGLQLKLRITAGRCEIETADTAETVVEAEPMNGSAASRAAVECLVEKLRHRSRGRPRAASSRCPSTSGSCPDSATPRC